MTTRIVMVAGLSIAAGAAATYWYLRPAGTSYIVLDPAGVLEPESSGASAAANVETLVEQRSAIAKRAAIYQTAARADESALQSMLQSAGDLPDSASKGMLIEALSMRAAEVAPETALDLIRQLPLDSRQAKELALALFDALGPSSQSVERVVAVLPPGEQRRFRIEALAHWAEKNPEQAFQEALAVGDRQLRASAAARVAAVWAEHDLTGAQAEADLLKDDNIGRSFRSAIVRRLGETDPAAMISYVNSFPQYENSLTQPVVEQLRLMEPREALNWAEQLDGNVGRTARGVALQSWGEQDPTAAFSYAQAMPLTDERQQLLHAIATGYGRQNPDAALAWLQSTGSIASDLSASVIAGIAQVDVKRALELAARDEPADQNGFNFNRWRFEMLGAVINNAMTTGDISVPDLMSRVLALRDRNERSNALRMLVDRWTRADPRNAFEWIVTEPSLPPDNAGELVSNLTRTDPVMAASYTQRVPAALRELWVANVAQNYARLDPQGALVWLGQFRDQPEYASAVAAIVQQAVSYDPVLAANLVGSLTDGGRNAQAAAETVARGWAGRDEQATRVWLRGLAEGPVRDAALRGFIGSTYRDTVPEPSLLSLFSSQETKQQAIMQVIYAVARDDRDEARRLVREHISSPALRTQAQTLPRFELAAGCVGLSRRRDHAATIYLRPLHSARQPSAPSALNVAMFLSPISCTFGTSPRRA